MIEIAVKFRVDNVDEMRGEVKAFLESLREYCNTNAVATAIEEGELTEEIGIGYRYDNGIPINDELQKLCEKNKVDDWRDISLYFRGTFATTKPNPAGERYSPYERDDISNKLHRAGVETLGDLIKHSAKEISRIELLGPKRIEAIRERLGELGLSLANE